MILSSNPSIMASSNYFSQILISKTILEIIKTISEEAKTILELIKTISDIDKTIF